ncbi:HAD-IIIC family phosphatase [Amycolatopsis sp. WAC 04169]|uniref:HAD-IIIC family phosphatase n=1 Tax=Amycolatopsis sp. WAC 04169 TaxID=2203197 RepID=UPI0026B07660
MDEPVLVKCLVWDLDNTLWRGTLLEAEVTLTEEVRATIVELDSRGILQSVASRNDHDHAWARLEALGVAEYFVLPHIGWGPKSASVKAIADELGFAPRTIAFIDDQPTERAEVVYHHPDVRCYDADELPDLTSRPEFSPAVITADGRQRRSRYQAGALRTEARESFSGSDEDFLRSLDLVLEIRHGDESDVSRVEELTLRTSRMNATGVQYSGGDLRMLLADPEQDVLVVTLRDKFGSHGAIGVVLLAYCESVWHLKLLATSCRVLSFGTGAAILNWLVDAAAKAEVHLAADFRRTERNRVMDIAYRFAGFADGDCACLESLGGGDRRDVRFRHLVPQRRPVPATMTLVAPDLRR